MKKPKVAKLPKQAESAKRGAAGQANSTKGRSRVFKDKTVYDRKAREIEDGPND
jgi:hypothetical protein